FPDVLAIESARKIGRRDIPLALLRHLHIATERDGRQRPLRPVLRGLAHRDDPPESDRKAQHLDAAPARDHVVAEFMEHHQNAQRDEKRDNLVGQVDHEAIFALSAGSLSHAAATRRASPSAASASSNELAGRAVTPASVAAQTAAMSVNLIAPSRNAATATSLAALRMAGAVPP